jgi:hypothetical protein
VGLDDIDELFVAFRHAWADDAVIELALPPGQAGINEGFFAGDVIAAVYYAACQDCITSLRTSHVIELHCLRPDPRAPIELFCSSMEFAVVDQVGLTSNAKESSPTFPGRQEFI